ncbi:ARM repeat-containing protein [Karstenula rhodostoma CBS 690.94]|uniref:ARM repeat-containing protein n=1 Tax=Karstenula rhodostoma CBS 690.94 TaxID=1392251 RepID=A0A9P4UCC6_9PLEO|nr:ARM repeat-containing protein [Karstenula rhodostoma CBS 690.94]
MFSTNDDSKQTVADLEDYLDQGPQASPQKLSEIEWWLKHLDSAESSESDVKVVQLLGTAAGKQWDEQRIWQDLFREHEILASVLNNLDRSTDCVALNNQYLRVIGNSVAYNDSNREVVLNHFTKIVSCLAERELRRTALAVLYNLGQDYEPANVQAAEARLDRTITQHLAADGIPEEAIDFATTIINRTTEKLTPAQLGDETSMAVFDDILRTAAQYDEDQCQDYVALIVHYLQDPEFQQKVAHPDVVQRLLELLLDLEFNELTKDEVHIAMQELATQNNPNETASEETSIILMVRLVNCVSALSATDAFIENFTLESRIVHTLKEKLVSAQAMPSTVCACVMLGNIATSDSVCIDIVQKLGLHEALIKILATRKEQALLYAAAGFMRHLTFPESNRPILGAAGLVGTCCHLFGNIQDPAVRGEGAAILCKLITDCLPNIAQLIRKSLPANIMLAPLPDVPLPGSPRYLHHVVRQALTPSAPLPSTSMKNSMIELGRTLVAILRYVRRPTSEGDLDEMTRCFFDVPAVARPIARLVRQRFYADARSEGLLGLGLMAQTPEGAACVIEEMKVDTGLLDVIKEFAGEQKGDAQKNNESAGRDYQNAVVLLHGLATNGGDGMDAALRSDVEALQAELSRLMVS